MKHILLGDTHGNKAQLADAINKINHLRKTSPDSKLIHLGDLGFAADWRYSESKFSDILRVVPGNHENYDYLEENNLLINLGNFGVLDFCDKKVFFVRGAYSIDKGYRIDYEKQGKGKVWWHQEELDLNQQEDCLELYKEFKPDVVLSHDCPDYVNYKVISDPSYRIQSSTGRFLTRLLHIHQPTNWYFGHYHTSTGWDAYGCRFRCLAIGETSKVDI